MQRPAADARAPTRAGLAALRDRPGIPPEYLDFRLRLHDLQWNAWDTLVARRPAGAVRPAAAGGPVSPADLALDDDLLRGLLESVAAALPARVEPEAGARTLLEAMRRSPPRLREIAIAASFDPVEAVLEVDAARSGCSVDALLFFGRVLAAPFVAEAVSRPGRNGAPDPTAPVVRCPACGATAGLAVISGERGARTLCCSLCGTSWASPRAHCPFCGGTTALGSLEEAGERERWLETCGECRRYILTVDARAPGRRGPVLPLVEVVAGLYLDLIAETHGCRRGLPYAALV